MKQRDKSLYLPVMWVGECRCGCLVFEVSDGTRFSEDTRKRHTVMECQRTVLVIAKAQ